MANIKSAKKRILTAEANHKRNVAFKTMIKTAVKKALLAGSEDDKSKLAEAVAKVYQLCDKAVSKGLMKTNTADRQKARLNLKVKNMK